MLRCILASSSPARLKTLRAAGVFPEVITPNVDESHDSDFIVELVQDIADRKGLAVRAMIGEQPDEPTVLIAADTMFAMDGVIYGKPHSLEVARQRLWAMSGSSGKLCTGHHVSVAPAGGPWRSAGGVAMTTVHFASMLNDEIEAYLASGEPLEVAGSFTIDGLGGPFISHISGDPHNVVGLSLPFLRNLLADLDVPWTSLWANPNSEPAD